MISTIPVLLLTGYLGSGKTTLLNRILANKRGIRFAVIVNDIGEVNIDANLIQQGGVVNSKSGDLVALSNGCICCTLKMDLVEQLHEILAKHAFDYIVIEASGICEPAPIAQTICNIPQLAPQYAVDGLPRLDSIVTVVDALRMRDEFMDSLSAVTTDTPKDFVSKLNEDDLQSLIIQQIEFCNLILLNKASEVSAEDLEKIKSIIRAIQPKADIIACDYCDVDLDRLLRRDFDFDTVAGSARWIEEIEGRFGEEEEEDEGEALEYGIETFVYQARKPMNLSLFDEFVAKHFPASVIRCKGMCYFEDEKDMCYVFEQAGRQVKLSQAGQWYATMPKEELEPLLASDAQLRADWDPVYGDRMQKLVFIGHNMDREAITRALNACIL